MAQMVPQEPQEQSGHLVKTGTPENLGPLVLKVNLVHLVSRSKALDLLVQQEKTAKTDCLVFLAQLDPWGQLGLLGQLDLKVNKEKPATLEILDRKEQLEQTAILDLPVKMVLTVHPAKYPVLWDLKD